MSECLASVAVAVIQATKKTEFEDISWMGLQMACRGSTPYLGFFQGQCADPDSYKAD